MVSQRVRLKINIRFCDVPIAGWGRSLARSFHSLERYDDKVCLVKGSRKFGSGTGLRTIWDEEFPEREETRRHVGGGSRGFKMVVRPCNSHRPHQSID